MLLFVLIALAFSNSIWSVYFSNFWEMHLEIRIGALEFNRSLKDLINDGLMTLFFFVVALELKRELTLGELRHPRIACLSIAGALGGMFVPAALYWMLQHGQAGGSGWGVVMSTDTALAMGCLALLGSRIPRDLRVFMLSLAIIDDIGAIMIVAFGYSHHLEWRAIALGLVGLVSVRGMALFGVRSIPIYFCMGILIWLVIDASGIHATITGVALGLLTPTRRWVSDERLQAILGRVMAYPPDDHLGGDLGDLKALRLAGVAFRESLSPVERLEFMLHPWIGFAVLPLFALANAGMPLKFADVTTPVGLAVFVGLAVGKPLGILTFSWLAVRLGLAIRPTGVSWIMLAGCGMLAGIGFTMALLITNLAYEVPVMNAAKMGILWASIVSAVCGVLVLFFYGRPSETDKNPRSHDATVVNT